MMDAVPFPVFVLSEDATYIYQNPAAAEAPAIATVRSRMPLYGHGCCFTRVGDGGFAQLKRTGHFSGRFTTE